MSPRPALVVGPLRLAYAEAWELQRRVQAARIEGRLPDTLVLVEHAPPVVTLGRGADAANLLVAEETLAAAGIELFRTDRGGDITYHGPGQVTGYPILSLDEHGRDLHRYLRNLEEVMLRALARYGLEGGRVEGLTGAWCQGAKVGAIGVKVRRWVTMHGFAFNVDPDLAHYRLIVPCGIDDRPVTSLARLLGGAAPPLAEVAGALAGELAEVFGLALEEVELEELHRRAG